MKQALIKDTIREIRKSLGRFFSIFMIVAIGVAFFGGIKASIPDMKYTADQYFDDYHLQDIQVLSTMGLTEEDIEAIKQVDGVEGVFATNSIEAITQNKTSSLVLKVHGMPSNQEEDNLNYINRLRLVEGRLPKQSGECVIEQGKMFENNLKIGDTIQLDSGTSTPITDTLATDTFTIVGTVFSPNYLSYEKGTASIGKGEIDSFLMILQEDFIVDYYSEALITVENAREINSYTDAYFEITDPVKEALESIGTDQSTVRFEEIKTEAQKEIDEGYEEYEKGKQAYEQGIEEGKKKLEEAHIQLLVGEATLQSQKQQMETLLTTGKTELETVKQQLELAQKKYEESLEKLEGVQPKLEEQIQEAKEQLQALEDEIQELDEKIKECETKLENPSLSDTERLLIQQEKLRYEAMRATKATMLQYQQTMLESLTQQLNQAKQVVDTAKQQMEQLSSFIQEKSSEIDAAIVSSQQEIEQAQQQIEAGKQQYETGLLELEKQEQLGKEELEIAKEKLEKAQYELDHVEEPQWYVLDRNSHYSYRDYESVTERMDGIAKVFPLFFLLVAALVCLTTMTRMVDEQRGTIGTLKALGYGKGAIAMKYILYAAIASIGGSIFGCIVGMLLFPYVIFNAWNIMYTLPQLQYTLQLPLAFASSLAVSSVTILAAVFACYKELVETPSLLMRPKAPKVGKKILLERIPWLWNRFNFTLKVTARNLFRYKKRFFMTVIGISGCTALLVAGFGIRNSINDVVNLQFNEIQNYDMQVTLKDDLTLTEIDEIETLLQEQDNVEDLLGIHEMNVTATHDGEDSAIMVIVPSDVQRFEEFITTRTRTAHDEVKLDNEGVILSEKLANNFKVGIGDTFTFTDKDDITREVTVSGICENYVSHYMYMSPTYYKQIFKLREIDNGYMVKLKDTSDAGQEQLGNTLLKEDGVTSVSFFNGIAESFDDTIQSLNIVIVVLIAAAGMLAFVVLYNLTNVNISERIREIATIKVLGFYDKEVSSYVYRENIMLTIIGALCGLMLGIWLHGMIMNLAEMENVMFGRNIYFLSFVYAFVITLLFAGIVNAFMYRKLKNVPMVESLKSVE